VINYSLVQNCQFLTTMFRWSGRLVSEEHVEQGPVTAATYLTYCRATATYTCSLDLLINYSLRLTVLWPRAVNFLLLCLGNQVDW